MPVVSINIGPKRVHLTAYCPDDELGLLACDYVLARAAVLLDGTSEADLRRWLIERDPEIAGLALRNEAVALARQSCNRALKRLASLPADDVQFANAVTTTKELVCAIDKTLERLLIRFDWDWVWPPGRPRAHTSEGEIAYSIDDCLQTLARVRRKVSALRLDDSDRKAIIAAAKRPGLPNWNVSRAIEANKRRRDTVTELRVELTELARLLRIALK